MPLARSIVLLVRHMRPELLRNVRGRSSAIDLTFQAYYS